MFNRLPDIPLFKEMKSDILYDIFSVPLGSIINQAAYERNQLVIFTAEKLSDLQPAV